MQARRLVLGLVSAGAAVGLTAAGCASSSGDGTSDASASSSEDGAADAGCTPQPVSLPDAGACAACLTGMCGSQLMACATDCTCGLTANTLTSCLASLPALPAEAGGFGALIGSAAPAVLACLTGGGDGGGAIGGLSGFGAAGGIATSPATTAYGDCIFTTCAMPCLGTLPLDGGFLPAPEAGPGEASPGDAPSGDAGSVEAGPAGEGGAPSEGGPGPEASTDGPTE